MHENQSKQLLFSHMEYIGDDFAADSQAIADHPETRVNIEWLKLRIRACGRNLVRRPISSLRRTKEDRPSTSAWLNF